MGKVWQKQWWWWWWWTHLGLVDDQTHERGHQLGPGQRRTLSLQVGFVQRESGRILGSRHRVRVSQRRHGAAAECCPTPGRKRHPVKSHRRDTLPGSVMWWRTGPVLLCLPAGCRSLTVPHLNAQFLCCTEVACVGVFTAHCKRPPPTPWTPTLP